MTRKRLMKPKQDRIEISQGAVELIYRPLTFFKDSE